MVFKASSMLELRCVQRFQELQKLNPAAYKWEEPPLLVLFVSHRWKSATRFAPFNIC